MRCKNGAPALMNDVSMPMIRLIVPIEHRKIKGRYNLYNTFDAKEHHATAAAIKKKDELPHNSTFCLLILLITSLLWRISSSLIIHMFNYTCIYTEAKSIMYVRREITRLDLNKLLMIVKFDIFAYYHACVQSVFFLFLFFFFFLYCIHPTKNLITPSTP